MTRVIFRADITGTFKDEITAIFPDMETSKAGMMGCYAHIGQHGECSDSWYLKYTRPAKPAEYADLLAELVRIGYDDLKVCKRR